MELGEKLQELRKRKGLTQEELAEALYVSRTAISKWESGRGYPSIDSLKQISGYFSVSIDDLLSGEKLLSLAETENKANVRDEILHTVACKAAIKAGWNTSSKELEVLGEKVQAGEVRFCPHGRPVAVKLSKYELEKMFKRA